MKLEKDYLEELKRRAKQSKVYNKYQLIGLQIAETLGDREHKSLYIRLAKNGNTAKLLWLAADVADRRGVKNRGAYFMALLKGSDAFKTKTPKKKEKTKKRNLAKAKRARSLFPNLTK